LRTVFLKISHDSPETDWANFKANISAIKSHMRNGFNLLIRTSSSIHTKQKNIVGDDRWGKTVGLKKILRHRPLKLHKVSGRTRDIQYSDI
jgi:hypothetical protein